MSPSTAREKSASASFEDHHAGSSRPIPEAPIRHRGARALHRPLARLRGFGFTCLVLGGAPAYVGAQADTARVGPSHGAAARDPHVVDAREGLDFRVFDGTGGEASLDAVLEAALAGEVLLVGEGHDDAVGHAVELELLVRLFGRLTDAAGGAEPDRPLVLSLEMFERDVQYVLDEYLLGLISEEHFRASARPWDNYVVAYRPLVELAKEHFIRVVAANAPRRYVSRVTAEGAEALFDLGPTAQSFLPPLPYPEPSERYRAEWNRLMSSDSSQAHGHAVGGNAIHAQALWDAAMGHAIATTLMHHPDALVVHIAGAFHVARGTGIPELVETYRPGTRMSTVVMVEEEDVGAWSETEHSGLADFVVLTATRARR